MFISQSLRNKIGKFCEDYGVYGLWDSDYSIRAKQAGRHNFYLKDLHTHHFGADDGEKSEYRKMKDRSLELASPIFKSNNEKYKNGQFYID